MSYFTFTLLLTTEKAHVTTLLIEPGWDCIIVHTTTLFYMELDLHAYTSYLILVIILLQLQLQHLLLHTKAI